MDTERLIAGLTPGFRYREFYASPTPPTELVIEVKEAGELALPSGRVVACDPGLVGWGDNSEPFDRPVPPGRYPVRVSIARRPHGGGNTALATVWFAPGAPVRFELAVKPGYDVSDLGPGEFYGHGVDSGRSAFMDPQAADFLARNKGRFDLGGDPANVLLDPESGLNLVAFTSGGGDGRYASFWGFDADDRLVCLVSDFNTVTRPPCCSCDAEVGALHEDDCPEEVCPFCGDIVGDCDCIVTVLGLNDAEREAVMEGEDATVEPVPTILARWREALRRKGRIPQGRHPGDVV